MKILVTGRNPMGHSWVAACGRAWTTTPLAVDVVDVKAGDYIKTVDINGNPLLEEDRKPCEDGDDPPPVEVQALNATTGRMEVRLRPDPVRIGRKTLALLEQDNRISIKQTDTVSQDAADAAVAAAKAEVQRQANEILELKARVAQLAAGDDLKAALIENDELKAKVAELEALLETATAGDAKKGTGKKG